MAKSLKKYSAVAVIVLVIITGVLYLATKSSKPKSDNLTINLPTETIQVKLLTTTKEQREGLSNQPSLPKGNGILMTFPTADYYSIWMPNMKFPIDVIWLDGDQKIVYLVKNMTPESYPQAFTPNQKAKFIIETNIGVIDRNNLVEGKKLLFSAQ